MQNLILQIIFYGFAALAVVSALMVILQNNPVRCALFLVVAFFASAILWILVKAEFLALILVLVYVGAVMTLFLFVVMMLNIDTESLKSHFARYLPFGLILVALLVGLLLISVPENWSQQSVEQIFTAQQNVSIVKKLSNTEAIGMVLYTDYVFAFELAALILLVAIIAAITLAHRNTNRSKRQNITKQIMTRSTDRVELLSMSSDSKERV